MTANRAAKQEARDQRKRDEMRERAAREKAEQEAERKEKLIRQERLKKLRDEQDRKRKEAYERGIAEKEKAALAASQKKAKVSKLCTVLQGHRSILTIAALDSWQAHRKKSSDLLRFMPSLGNPLANPWSPNSIRAPHRLDLIRS